MSTDSESSPTWTLLHAGALGDLLLTLHLLMQIEGVGANTHIRMISRVDPGDWGATQPQFSRRSLDGLGLHWLHGHGDDAPPAALLAEFAGRRVLNACGSPADWISTRLRSLGPSDLICVDPHPQPGDTAHISAQWRRQLEEQGIQFSAEPRWLAVPEALRTAGRVSLADVVRDVSRAILLHPGSGGRRKCWPLRAWLELTKQLQSRGCSCVVLLGPVELETWSDADRALLAAAGALLPTSSATELSTLLAGAAAYVGNDAGPTHLAALLGTTTFAIFGPTCAAEWQPLGPAVHVIAGDPRQADDWGLSPAAIAAAMSDCLCR